MFFVGRIAGRRRRGRGEGWETTGDGVEVTGDGVEMGDGVEFGDGMEFGDGVEVGDGVETGEGVDEVRELGERELEDPRDGEFEIVGEIAGGIVRGVVWC